MADARIMTCGADKNASKVAKCDGWFWYTRRCKGVGSRGSVGVSEVRVGVSGVCERKLERVEWERGR